MKKSVKVSVIMSVYNPGDFSQVRLAVESILDQTLEDLEFLIYDDGSDQGTGKLLRELAGKDDRIRLLGGGENKGIAAGLNACIRQSRGEYIARMDADDISLPRRLERQAEFLSSHPEYGFVGCCAGLLEGSRIRGHRSMPEAPKSRDFLPYSPYIHPSVMFRRPALTEAGGYSESRHTLRCEDYDLFMRLHVLGCYGYNLQEELFLYREDTAAYQRRKFRYRLDELRLRRKGFPALGLRGPLVLAAVFRPLLAGLLPKKLLKWMKGFEIFRKERWNGADEGYRTDRQGNPGPGDGGICQMGAAGGGAPGGGTAVFSGQGWMAHVSDCQDPVQGQASVHGMPLSGMLPVFPAASRVLPHGEVLSGSDLSGRH